MSSKTISGCRAAARATVVALSSASPTTCISGCVWRISRMPSRTSAWSSTMRMLIWPWASFIAVTSQRDDKFDVGPLAGEAGHRQPAAEQGSPFPHRGEAGARGYRGARRADREPGSVVLDPPVQFVRGQGDSDQHRPRAAVPQRVADRFPEDEESLVEDGGRRPRFFPADAQPYVGGCGHVGSDGVDVLDQGLFQAPDRVLPQIGGYRPEPAHGLGDRLLGLDRPRVRGRRIPPAGELVQFELTQGYAHSLA